jgi:hypothetical protein
MKSNYERDFWLAFSVGLFIYGGLALAGFIVLAYGLIWLML